ncbi:MAG: metallophosphoesterase, partial [Bacteroidales bacterium]|nr:metallophosphoesterase [Bacteroidales bacterium]
MKILHITDIHSNFDTLRTIIVPNKFDLLLISGDITHFGGTSDLKTAIEILDSTGIAYYAVTGNCDKPECEQYLRNYLKSIDSNVVDLETVSLTGLSGSLHCPGKTPNEFSEKDFAAKLSIIEQKLRPSRPFIFVAHQPPYNTLNDKLVTGMHTGSKNIRKFI